tara:strand:+ start:308 stop:499 length:192 start_codon:yes stop_codon:yes gene_type:complete
MSRKITLNIKGGSKKQYSTLVLELSVMAKSWKRFGVDIKLPGQEKIVEWGGKSNKDASPEAPN